MLTTAADDTNTSLYIEVDTLLSDVHTNNGHSLSNLSFLDSSFALTNNEINSDDIDTLFDSNFSCSLANSIHSSQNVDTNNLFFTQDLILGQNLFPEVEAHKPLFGVHPLFVPFSQDSVNPSASQLSDTTLYKDLQNDFNDSAVAFTSTPLKSQCSVLPNESGKAPAACPSQELDPNSYNWVTSSDGKLKVQCQKCGVFINTGASTKNLGPIIKHMAGKKCLALRNQYAANQQFEMRRASNARNTFFRCNDLPNFRKRLENSSANSLDFSGNIAIDFDIVTPSKFREGDYSASSIDR